LVLHFNHHVKFLVLDFKKYRDEFETVFSNFSSRRSFLIALRIFISGFKKLSHQRQHGSIFVLAVFCSRLCLNFCLFQKGFYAK
jgi:hypothetical protein